MRIVRGGFTVDSAVSIRNIVGRELRRNMLIVNLWHGYNVIGTYTDGKCEPKNILEKQL